MCCVLWLSHHCQACVARLQVSNGACWFGSPACQPAIVYIISQPAPLQLPCPPLLQEPPPQSVSSTLFRHRFRIRNTRRRIYRLLPSICLTSDRVFRNSRHTFHHVFRLLVRGFGGDFSREKTGSKNSVASRSYLYSTLY